MSMTDPIADLLTRIRNGQEANKTSIAAPASAFRESVLSVLKREGYIRDFSRVNVRPGIDELKIELKYFDGEPVIKEISRVSRPGRRVYSKIKELPRVYNGLGIAILSTPRGVMSDTEAREANVGGEVLCHVF
jgi:small subunit ribosomal protein S8